MVSEGIQDTRSSLLSLHICKYSIILNAVAQKPEREGSKGVCVCVHTRTHNEKEEGIAKTSGKWETTSVKQKLEKVKRGRNK